MSCLVCVEAITPYSAQADEKIKALLEKLDDLRRRRAFLLGFSHAPTEFINSMVASQARDLRHVSATQLQVAEAPLRHEVFQGKWVDDAAMRYLSQRAQAQRQAQLAAQAVRLRPVGMPPTSAPQQASTPVLRPPLGAASVPAAQPVQLGLAPQQVPPPVQTASAAASAGPPASVQGADRTQSP